METPQEYARLLTARLLGEPLTDAENRKLDDWRMCTDGRKGTEERWLLSGKSHAGSARGGSEGSVRPS
ncbi:unknown [Bacteroides sp. CAG:462]|nr:unknown [Bacteroides sp. CAG:462]